MVRANQIFAFVVTHVEADSDGQYLKIWAQTDEAIVHSIASSLIPLQGKFDSETYPQISPSNLLPNTRCCARTVNHDFSRARIIKLLPNGMVAVQFVDYGNISYVPIHNIRLPNGSPESDFLHSIPDAASVFVLADVMPISDTWPDKVVNSISSILINNKFFGMYQNMNNCKLLKFSIQSEDFAKILIQRFMAAPSNSYSINNSQPIPTQHQLRSAHQEVQSHENWRSAAVQQNQASVQKIVKPNSFKAIQLDFGSVHDVQVSYVEEGPCKFSVQLLESIPLLNTLMEKINSRPHLQLHEPPMAGMVCLGLQTHTNRYCRVVLNSPGDISCKAFYVDYGHHETLPFDKLFKIPDEFVVPNVFSIRFTLNGIPNWNVTQEMKDYFGGIVTNARLKLIVCKGPLSPLTQYCDLFLDGTSVKDILIEQFPGCCIFMYPEPKRLKIDAKEKVFVSFVESAAKFFVQLDSDTNLLEDIMKQIEHISKSASKLNKVQLRNDMPCIAQYDVDRKWYRASILGTLENDKFLVFYVDYGNEEIVSIENMRAIPSQLVENVPKLAIKCGLDGFQSKYKDAELTKNMEILVLDEPLCLTVMGYSNDTHMVNLNHEQNKFDVASRLKASGYSQQQEASMRLNNQNEWNSDMAPKSGPIRNQRSDAKSSVPKTRTKNKNVKARENTANTWDRDAQLQSKFRKDNENEQRLDNRYRKNTDHSNGPQNNQLDSGRNDRFNHSDRSDRFNQSDRNDRFNQSDRKDRFNQADRNERFNQNDRFNRNSDSQASRNYSSNDRSDRSSNDFNARKGNYDNQPNRNNTDSRLDRSVGSDKDSDTSSRSGGRRNNRRRSDEQRTRETPSNNRNRIGRWENEQEQDSSRNTQNNQMAMATKSRSQDKLERPKSLTVVSKIPPPNITVGAVKNCVMVYYLHPEHFFVQLVPDNEELNSVMDKILSIYENNGQIVKQSDIKEGLQCIAQYSADDQWYRAVVQSVESRSATVFFVDYGNMETVGFDKIKEITPDLVKLPAQAIHCKLFCPAKLNYDKQESDLLVEEVDEKLLEADFVVQQKGVYEVLIKKADSSDRYVNDYFANGLNLIEEKEKLRNKTRSTPQVEAKSFDYASLEDKWLESKLELGTPYKVLLAWSLNPEHFYCQLESQEKEFRAMMNEIQTNYVKRPPVSEPLKVGHSVIAVLPEDGVLYRAKILELNKPKGHIVQYIDYGDSAMVDPRKIYPVEKKYMKLPRQSIFCSLKNIAPVNGSKWTDSAKISQFLCEQEKYGCIFHELQNDKYLISLKNKADLDISKALVENGIAVYSSVTVDLETQAIPDTVAEKLDIPKVDINLLEGQTLHVKVSSVEGVGKFYIQYCSAEICQGIVNNYMAAKDSKVMPALSSHEVCLGAGCLVKNKGKWRRGVVVNVAQSNYEVRLIDTGEHEIITLNSMLKLPGQLSVMQNQAIECSLFDVSLSSKADEMLKKAILGKDVKIFVEKVESNRLIVRLFDVNGNKIKVADTQNTEKIAPVCSMQILNSTHDVSVTWVNNSKSVWLQRSADSEIEGQLLENLYEFYSTEGEVIAPVQDELYAALCSDSNWYRVKALEVNDSEVKVMFIDYGNVEVVSIENIRKLDPQFYSPHQLGINVSLTVNLSGDNSSQQEILQPLLENKVFTATFYNVNRIWLAELSENGDKISDKLKLLDIVKETTKTQHEFIEPSDMIVGEKYDVIVSHVDNPNQLWLQRSEAQNSLFDLQAQLQEAAETCPEIAGVPEEMSLCLAMYSVDNEWYRAQVVDADSEITTVRFIDYGNADSIIEPGRIKQLPEKWKTTKNFAVQCKLDILPANIDDWTEEAIVKAKNLILTDSPLKALVIADKAPMRVDLLLQDGYSVCEILVEEKLATYVQSSEQPEEEEEEVLEEIEFDPRSAFVSNLVSVDEFWMQEEKYFNDLNMIEDRLVVASILPAVQKIEQGLLCIAHFPYDNKYYRAIVLSHDEHRTKVQYIDYGNSALTEDIRTIPQDLADIQPLSRKCRLAKPDGVEQWPENINPEFIKLSADGVTTFLLDVIDEGSSCLVKLTEVTSGKDVALKLIELCKKTSVHSEDEGIIQSPKEDIAKKQRPPPLGEENTSAENVCKVCSFCSPSKFFIHKVNQLPELREMFTKILSVAPLRNAIEIHEGKILAMKYEDGPEYYRCKVESRKVGGTKVFFIDYGTISKVKSESLLFDLPEDIISIAPLALHCSLKLPENLKSWPTDASELFEALIANGETEFRFQILENEAEEPVTVSLWHKGQSVTDLLLNLDYKLEEEITSLNLQDQQNVSVDSAIQLDVEVTRSEKSPFVSRLPNVETVRDESLESDIDASDITVLNAPKLGDQEEEVLPKPDIIENVIKTKLNLFESKAYQKEETITSGLEAKETKFPELETLAAMKSGVDQREKIVPGCISRGISVDEIQRYSPVHRSTTPEEKIVPGSINKGSVHPEIAIDDALVEAPAVARPKVQETPEFGSSPGSSPTSVSHDERVVPSCISRGETPIEMDRPTTPKTPHSEKLLSGAVNALAISPNEGELRDEVLSLVVDEDILVASERLLHQ